MRLKVMVKMRDHHDGAHDHGVVAVQGGNDKIAADPGIGKMVSTITEPVSKAAAAGPA